MDAPVALARKVLPATVTIHARVPAEHPSAQILGEERMGTGGVIDREGHILTVNYVVLGADRITVAFLDGREQPARIVSRDFESGLAVIRTAPGRHPALALGDSRRVAPGQAAFLVASLGDEARRVTAGIVSAVEPFDAYWEYMLDRAIFFTAPNPGVGGGPLLNGRGELVGVVSLNLNEIARMSLAIPLEAHMEGVEERRRPGRAGARRARAWVGFYPEPTEEGLVVAGVVPRGPADRCGIEEGDVILAVGGQRVEDRRALYRALWNYRAGEAVQLTVLRRSAVKTVSVTSQDRAEFYY